MLRMEEFHVLLERPFLGEDRRTLLIHGDCRESCLQTCNGCKNCPCNVSPKQSYVHTHFTEQDAAGQVGCRSICDQSMLSRCQCHIPARLDVRGEGQGQLRSAVRRHTNWSTKSCNHWILRSSREPITFGSTGKG